MNLIDEFESILKKYTDAPPHFIRGCGYWLISATMGKYIWFYETTHKYPWVNLYVVLSSDPGFTRRSTVISCAKYVYRHAMRDFLEKTGKSAEEATLEVERRFCEEFTVEGLADRIAILPHPKEVVLTSDELGAFLLRARGKYLLGSLSILSKLYYAEGYVQALSTRGGKFGERVIPEGVYATMLAGMQKPKLYMDKLSVQQGLLRRLLLICVDAKDLNADNYLSLIHI